MNNKSDNKNKSVPKVPVRTGLRPGGPILQHGVRVRTGVKAGPGGSDTFGSSTHLNHGLRVRQPTR